MRTPAAATRVALAHTPYRKSSRSSATGNCVLVGSAGSWVGIQDSKEHPNSAHRTTLATVYPQWASFLRAIKNSQIHC